MYEEAIKTLAALKKSFPDIHSVTVIDTDWILLSIPTHEQKEVTFGSVVKMLEWCETHLNQRTH